MISSFARQILPAVVLPFIPATYQLAIDIFYKQFRPCNSSNRRTSFITAPQIIALLLLFFLAVSQDKPLYAQPLSFQNTQPRLDLKGNIIDAHDGRVIKFGDRYYWYGTSYGRSNGFTNQNEYVCYSSPDLSNWKFEGRLLPKKPAGIYYRPHVVYNKRTRKYILWYNWYPKLWDGYFGVAQSDNPTGPFEIIKTDVKVKHSQLGVGDFGLFTDNDGTCYLSYNTIKGHRLSVEKLDEKYTASTMQNGGFITENCEAGSMFKQDGMYYLLTDITCCFCTQGSGARVYTAQNALDSFVYRQNINRYPGRPVPVLHNGRTRDNLYENILKDSGEEIEVWLDKTAGSLNTLQIVQFTGDRNGRCGEVNEPLVHDTIEVFDFELSCFNNGEWKPLGNVSPQMQNEALTATYTFNLKTVKASRIRIKPVFKGKGILHLSELKVSGATIHSAYINGKEAGRPIIPAQQTYVMQTEVNGKPRFIWMGDLWGSATDHIKGHDFQFWSAPLQFYSNGLIKQLEWTDGWTSKQAK